MKHVFSKYLTVGVFSFSIDFGVYIFALALGAMPVFAKFTSFLCGMILSFILNKRFTFKVSESRYGKIKFSFIYGLSLVANVGVNTVIIVVYPAGVMGSYFVAFLLASMVSILINFFGMKKLVFNN